MPDAPVEPLAAGTTTLPRNKGVALVESFRLARIAARPALRTDLRVGRTALQHQRLIQLGHGNKQASPGPKTAAAAVPDAVASMMEKPSDAEANASVFATYCTTNEVLPSPEPPPAPAPPEAVQPVTAAAAVPLSAIGFGPGMTIRLGQLGIETATDLAVADHAWLQTALGDLSDLVHAERWIASAREACGKTD